MSNPVGYEAAGATIARRVREVRARRGWSQDDLAARIREIGGRISRPVLYRIEEGGTRAHRLSVEDFLIIAAALGVAPHFLMTDVSDEAGRGLAVTPKVAMIPAAARAWMAGVGNPPGDEDLRFYLSERPGSELERMHAQWIAAADDLREGHGALNASAPDPRVVEDDIVRRVPPLPIDDRRKSAKRGGR